MGNKAWLIGRTCGTKVCSTQKGTFAPHYASTTSSLQELSSIPQPLACWIDGASGTWTGGVGTTVSPGVGPASVGGVASRVLDGPWQPLAWISVHRGLWGLSSLGLVNATWQSKDSPSIPELCSGISIMGAFHFPSFWRCMFALLRWRSCSIIYYDAQCLFIGRHVTLVQVGPIHICNTHKLEIIQVNAVELIG